MFSSLQRLNHLTSLATTYLMVLLALVSVASFLSLPEVDVGKIDIKDLVMSVYFTCFSWPVLTWQKKGSLEVLGFTRGGTRLNAI